jgi:hypothetical protein
VDPLRKSRLGYVHPANVIGVVAEIGNNCHAKRRSGRTLPAEGEFSNASSRAVVRRCRSRIPGTAGSS